MNENWVPCGMGCRGWDVFDEGNTIQRCDTCRRFQSDLEAFAFAISDDLPWLRTEVKKRLHIENLEERLSNGLTTTRGEDYACEILGPAGGPEPTGLEPTSARTKTTCRKTCSSTSRKKASSAGSPGGMTMTLPDKLSDLMGVALRDIAKCERSPKYTVDMENYFHLPLDGVCSVCFAGGVMAHELGVPPYKEATPLRFDADTRRKLDALDDVRLGNLYYALNRLGVKDANVMNRDVPDYAKDRSGWKRAMRKIIHELRAEGL